MNVYYGINSVSIYRSPVLLYIFGNCRFSPLFARTGRDIYQNIVVRTVRVLETISMEFSRDEYVHNTAQNPCQIYLRITCAWRTVEY